MHLNATGGREKKRNRVRKQAEEGESERMGGRKIEKSEIIKQQAEKSEL